MNTDVIIREVRDKAKSDLQKKKHDADGDAPIVEASGTAVGEMPATEKVLPTQSGEFGFGAK